MQTLEDTIISACAEHRLVFGGWGGRVYFARHAGLRVPGVRTPGVRTKYIDCTGAQPLSRVIEAAPDPSMHSLPEAGPPPGRPAIRSTTTREAVRALLCVLLDWHRRRIIRAPEEDGAAIRLIEWALVALASNDGWPSALRALPLLARLARVHRWDILRAAALEQRLDPDQVSSVMQCADPEVIALVLNRTRSLHLVIDKDRPVERDDQGVVYRLRPPLQRAALLEVICPSTGATHMLCVPSSDAFSPREARRWTMHGVEPEVET